MGFKSKEAVVTANNLIYDKPESNNYANNSKTKEVAINLGATFDAIVIDKHAPPSPKLPIITLHAIGTRPCKMAHKDVSCSVLNYDSFDD